MVYPRAKYIAQAQRSRDKEGTWFSGKVLD